MDDFFDEDAASVSAQSTLVLVAGSGLEAELSDRALAYQLRSRILTWQDHEPNCEQPLRPIVVSDLWYVNTQDLRLRPSITIGRPETNAAAAYLATRIPTALVVDDRLRIHLDPELVDEKACIWGVDASATRAALDLFVQRYLDIFLRRIYALPHSRK